MKSFNLFPVFLICVSVVCAAPYITVQELDVYCLTDADEVRARDIIAAEDNPQLLSDIFGDHPRINYDDFTTSVLYQLIEYNRFNSFISFFPRVNLVQYVSARISMYFNIAARAQRFEICDYLLSTQKFHVGDGWHDSLAGWDMDVLKALLAAHQDRIWELAGGLYVFLGADARAIFANLNSIEYCRSINPVFAVNVDYHPSNLFGLVIRNENLRDGDMAQIISKVLSMEPTVDPTMVQQFQADHPEFFATNQLLSEYFDIPIKEPPTLLIHFY